MLTRMSRATDYALAAAATARLTRLITTDTLGDWTIVAPATRWALAHEPHIPDDTQDLGDLPGWRSRLTSGLTCPYCVGTWIGYGILTSYTMTRNAPRARATWRFITGGLALNYLVGHVSSRID